MIDLNILWFILIGVLFAGFFFLEGFDFGVGMLSFIIGKNDNEKRLIINTIGHVWDGNEVWLLTAGGAIFAAFPNWYATLFSGFYLALFLILVCLIVRAVAFEYRSKLAAPAWRTLWDIVLLVSSLLIPLLFAVAMVNLLKGVPIDGDHEFVGNFFDLLSVPTVSAGLAAVAIFLYHGSVYLALKVDILLVDRVYAFGKKVGVVALALGLGTVATLFPSTDIASRPIALAIVGVSAVAGILSYLLFINKKAGLAFIANGVAILAGVAALFVALFPRVMISSIDPANSLTIFNASSSPYTLKIMTIVTVTVLPVVLFYIAWTYWTFRNRVTKKDLEY